MLVLDRVLNGTLSSTFQKVIRNQQPDVTLYEQQPAGSRIFVFEGGLKDEYKVPHDFVIQVLKENVSVETTDGKKTINNCMSVRITAPGYAIRSEFGTGPFDTVLIPEQYDTGEGKASGYSTHDGMGSIGAVHPVWEKPAHEKMIRGFATAWGKIHHHYRNENVLTHAYWDLYNEHYPISLSYVRTKAGNKEVQDELEAARQKKDLDAIRRLELIAKYYAAEGTKNKFYEMRFDE